MGYNHLAENFGGKGEPAKTVYFPMGEMDIGGCESLIEHSDKGKETSTEAKATWKIVRLKAFELTEQEIKEHEDFYNPENWTKVTRPSIPPVNPLNEDGKS